MRRLEAFSRCTKATTKNAGNVFYIHVSLYSKKLLKSAKKMSVGLGSTPSPTITSKVYILKDEYE